MLNLQPTTHNLLQKITTILLLVVGSWLLVGFSVFADEPGDSDFIYLFHLYYDNDQIFADRDFEFKYDVIPEEFTQETYNTQFPFKGEIINLKNEVTAEFLFDPRRGDPDFLKGKISVKAPYVPDGQKVVFYDSQGRQLLTVFVSESSFCNDDGVCNFDRGENENTCPNDCKGVAATPPRSDEGFLSTNVMILITLVVAMLAAGGWYTWRKWRKVKYVQENEFTDKLE